MQTTSITFKVEHPDDLPKEQVLASFNTLVRSGVMLCLLNATLEKLYDLAQVSEAKADAN